MNNKIYILLILSFLILTSCRTSSSPTSPDSGAILIQDVEDMFLEPDKGDIYYLGDIIDIEYRSFSNSERVNIYLEKKGDIVFTVRENVPNNGVYKWNSPSSLRPSVHFQVKIVDASRTNVFILSERFGIIAK